MSFTYNTNGFAAIGTSGATAGNVADWIGWHFTHVSNIPSVASTGGLYPHSAAVAHTNVANEEIRRDRLATDIPIAAPYPTSTVGEHVPFYFASRSPMLFRVAKQRSQNDLVFFGVGLGDVDASAAWCATDGNARSYLTQFTAELSEVGGLVDLDALSEQYWNHHVDTDRKRRRQAELLVHQHVPLSLVRFVVCRTEAVRETVRSALAGAVPAEEFHVVPALYF